MSAFNISLNPGSRITVTFTPPSNSRSIRASSSAVHRRSLPVSAIAASTDWLEKDGRKNLIWMVDKHGEVADLRVERAVGIQGKPPSTQPITKSTVWIFGNLEKSKDCSGAPKPSISGDNVSTFRAGASWARRRDGTYNSIPPCTTASRGSRHTLLRALRSSEGTRTCHEYALR